MCIYIFLLLHIKDSYLCMAIFRKEIPLCLHFLWSLILSLHPVHLCSSLGFLPPVLIEKMIQYFSHLFWHRVKHNNYFTFISYKVVVTKRISESELPCSLSVVSPSHWPFWRLPCFSFPAFYPSTTFFFFLEVFLLLTADCYTDFLKNVSREWPHCN